MKGGVDGIDWVGTHPRESLQLLLLGACVLWQTPVAIFSFMLFLILTRVIKLVWWYLLSCGVFIAALTVVLQAETVSTGSLMELLKRGVTLNALFWHSYLKDGFFLTAKFLWQEELIFLMGFPMLIAGFLAILELIPNSPHEKALRSLQRGRLLSTPEIKEKQLNRRLQRFPSAVKEGTLVGISKTSGKAVIIPDNHVNQIVLVLGTTGGGKTITLRRFYQRAITANYPLIIVDGKPTEESVEWIEKLTQKLNRPFYGFNCGNFFHYDPLAHGGYTELKDKIISLKDEWENDYYKSIAEDYLQTTFEVLLKRGGTFDLQTVVNCLSFEELIVMARECDDKRLHERVKRLENYERKDITGLQAHLNLLIHSELGEFFERTPATTFSLTNVIQNNAIVYFALPALRFPTFSKVLGKLIINDIKAVIDRNLQNKKIFTVFDEFSVFAGEQVLNLVNMGRGKGVHAIFGTQGLSDLKRVDAEFGNQVLNCVNTLICHRLNDQESAESVAAWVGTKETFNVTAQISMNQGATGQGSIRRVKEFLVHPDDIKQTLNTGGIFYVTKVGQFRVDKVKVKFS